MKKLLVGNKVKIDHSKGGTYEVEILKILKDNEESKGFYRVKFANGAVKDIIIWERR